MNLSLTSNVVGTKSDLDSQAGESHEICQRLIMISGDNLSSTLAQFFLAKYVACLSAAPVALNLIELIFYRQMPPPRGDPSGCLRMLLFDAFHDEYRGVICLVTVVVRSKCVETTVCCAFRE
jgi:hypothetical protein